MKAMMFDRKFDSGNKVVEHLDLSKVRRIGTDAKRVSVDSPGWMVESLSRGRNRGRSGGRRLSLLFVSRHYPLPQVLGHTILIVDPIKHRVVGIAKDQQTSL